MYEKDDEYVVIDIETLGTRIGSPIIAIGACRITKRMTSITDTFYMEIDLQDAIDKAYRAPSGSTIEWWMKQSDEARKLFSNKEKMNAITPLVELAKLIKEDDIVLGNGSDFDIAFLTDAYIEQGIDVPWKHYNVGCFRTMKRALPQIELVEEEGDVHHNALSDALWQARYLITSQKNK